jgi:hypothetical protein
MFETDLDKESEDQLGTFGEITLDKKISRYCPFKLKFSPFATGKNLQNFLVLL